jgi:ABC-type multidrug transport system fused ATPase/permease subunit
MGSLRRLLPYVRPDRGRVGFGLVCLLIAQPLGLVGPLFWKCVIGGGGIAEEATHETLMARDG